MSIEVAHDLTSEFTAEDEAIERVVSELQAHDASADDVRYVLTEIHKTGTTIIETTRFRIRRDPDEYFHLDWKAAA